MNSATEQLTQAPFNGAAAVSSPLLGFATGDSLSQQFNLSWTGPQPLKQALLNSLEAATHGRDDRLSVEARRTLVQALRGSEYGAVIPTAVDLPLLFDGEEHWIHVDVIPAGASPAVIFTNATHAHRERENEHSRERWLASIFQNSTELVSIIDETGTIKYSSPAMRKLLGYQPEERTGRAGFSLIHPEEQAAAVEAFRSLLGSPGKSVTHEHRVLHVDGNWRWMEATARNLLDEPSVRGIVINSRDITIRKEAEERQAHFVAVVEASDEAIVATTADGLIRSWNPSAEQLYGYVADEVIGKHISLLMPPEAGDELERIFRRLQYGARIAEYETVRLRKDGTRVTVSLSMSPIRNQAGETIGYSTIIRDISGRLAAETALRESAESFKSLFHARTEGMVIHENSIIVDANRAYAELVGCPVVELIGRSTFEFIAEESKPIAEAAVRAGTETSYQILARRTDGTHLPVDVLARPIRFRGRNMRLISVRDYSEQWAADAAVRASEERFRTLVQKSSDLITVVGHGGVVRYCSPSIIRFLGYTEAEFDILTREELVHPDDIQHLSDAWNRVAESSDLEQRVEYRVKHGNGSYVWVDAVLTGLMHDPAVRGIICNARDVTERKAVETRLRFTTELLDQALAAVIATTNDGVITHWNRHAEELFGWNRAEAIGQNAHWLIPGLSLETSGDNFRGDGRWDVECVLANKVGEPVDVHVSNSHVFDDQGTPIGLVSVSVDIRQRKTLEEQLRHNALHDPLTGLPNRALLADRLTHALDQSVRRGALVAVLFLDLDRFKLINDGFGHAVGDKVLRDVAGRLEASLRAGDTLARIGGDEFVVLLEDIHSEADVSDVAERLANTLERPFDLDGREMRIGVSIGVAMGSAGRHDPERLMSEADTALYRAKSSTRGSIAFFNPSMRSNVELRLSLDLDLRRAIQRGEFELHYQPIVELGSGDIQTFEALARWKHPVHGLIPPSEFIPLAEDSGMIIPLGRWVAREACRQVAKWMKLDPVVTPQVSINISPIQFREPHLATELAQEIQRAGIAPNQLQLEITEHLLVEDVESTARTLAELRSIGVKIAIDDFGTGYSSLGYLRHLPVDVIKLDRTFVRGLGSDAGSLAIVEAITSLSHSLGLQVTAEGIETAEQLAYVRSAGCDKGQGFLLAKPAPAKDTVPWLTGSMIEHVLFGVQYADREAEPEGPDIALKVS